MNYYVIKDRRNGEVIHAYATPGWLTTNNPDNEYVNRITKAEYETLEAFGIPSREIPEPNWVRIG